jgi:hypothetical protein
MSNQADARVIVQGADCAEAAPRARGHRSWPLAIAAVVLLIAGSATPWARAHSFASEPPTAPPTKAPIAPPAPDAPSPAAPTAPVKPDAPSPLAGPSVKPSAPSGAPSKPVAPGAPHAPGAMADNARPASPRLGATTLVETTFDGNVVRLPTSPEAAACAKLALSDEHRAACDAIFVRRARVLDEFVSNHLDILVKLNTASGSGDKRDALAQLLQAVSALRGLNSDGSLQGQIRRALPQEQRPSFDAMVNGYWDAIYQERFQTASRAGEAAPARLAILVEERLKNTGKEIENAFKRQLASGGILQSYLTRDLGLSPEQELKVRELTERFTTEAGESPTEAQKASYGLRLLSMLNSEQRQKLIKRFRNGM